MALETINNPLPAEQIRGNDYRTRATIPNGTAYYVLPQLSDGPTSLPKLNAPSPPLLGQTIGTKTMPNFVPMPTAPTFSPKWKAYVPQMLAAPQPMPPNISPFLAPINPLECPKWNAITPVANECCSSKNLQKKNGK
ncbi:hypothetical protein niasHT_029413 [Heterodera trifolii]|uniref:Uncharacterized protein n=1 Tax=Heterodera trifolii TaxID=157864 RepID=A0ABD2KQ07_9BILA